MNKDINRKFISRAKEDIEKIKKWANDLILKQSIYQKGDKKKNAPAWFENSMKAAEDMKFGGWDNVIIWMTLTSEARKSIDEELKKKHPNSWPQITNNGVSVNKRYTRIYKAKQTAIECPSGTSGRTKDRSSFTRMLLGRDHLVALSLSTPRIKYAAR